MTCMRQDNRLLFINHQSFNSLFKPVENNLFELIKKKTTENSQLVDNNDKAW